jgi:DNA-binding XRE family transcriptional regulator
MGVSRQTINSIENDRYTPSTPLAMALTGYFGVTVEEMFVIKERGEAMMRYLLFVAFFRWRG